MLPDVQLAVRLQELDLKAAELKKEIEALPRHIAEIEKKLNTHERKLEADRAALAANQKDRKRLEGEIQVQEQKISKLKGQTLEAKTNEQYRAFQTEIEFCQAEIRKCEDRILDLMTESEPLDLNVKSAEAALKEERKHVEQEKGVARERTAADEAALRTLETERAAVAAKITGPVLAAYERIRKGRRGVAVAEAIDGRCSQCHLSIRPQFFQELRRGERVQFCENCGRILFYNAPQSFENLVGPEHSVAH